MYNSLIEDIEGCINNYELLVSGIVQEDFEKIQDIPERKDQEPEEPE